MEFLEDFVFYGSRGAARAHAPSYFWPSFDYNVKLLCPEGATKHFAMVPPLKIPPLHIYIYIFLE